MPDDGDGTKDPRPCHREAHAQEPRWVEQGFEIEGPSAALLSEVGNNPTPGGRIEIQVMGAAAKLAPGPSISWPHMILSGLPSIMAVTTYEVVGD